MGSRKKTLALKQDQHRGKNVKAAASKFSPHPYEKNVGRFETGNSFFEAGSCLRTNRKWSVDFTKFCWIKGKQEAGHWKYWCFVEWSKTGSLMHSIKIHRKYQNISVNIINSKTCITVIVNLFLQKEPSKGKQFTNLSKLGHFRHIRGV